MLSQCDIKMMTHLKFTVEKITSHTGTHHNSLEIKCIFLSLDYDRLKYLENVSLEI